MSLTNGRYHYLGAAKVLAPIGKAFAEEMVNTMAHCTDGSFYYQPNRDNAGYHSDSRMTASSVSAFIFTIPKRSLVITGKDAKMSRP